MVKNLKRKDLGIKRNRLYVLNYSRVPAVLIEPLFLTNPAEYTLINKTKTRQLIAQSVANGLEKYFNN